jgi:hypothetical protein
MNREMLIEQVKNEYSRLADQASQQHFSQTTSGEPAEEYYEKLLGMVEKEIAAGNFDGFRSGKEIVEAVANDKNKWLPQWQSKYADRPQ